MADDFRQEIQLVADQALRTLSDLDKRTEVYTRAIEKQIRGVQAFNKANGAFIAGLKAQQNQMVANARAAAQMGSASNNTVINIRNVGRTAQTTQQQVQTLTLSYNSFVRLVTSQVVSRAIGSVVGEFRDATSVARQFEITLARIQTLDAEFRSRSLNNIGGTLAGLSGRFGLPVEQLATGLYDTLSNQINGATESVNVFSDALRLQTLVGGTASNNVDLLTAGINAYELSLGESTALTEKFFKTIDFGRVTAEELGNTAGRVFAPAAQLGITIDEVLASIAGVTTVGVSARESLTQLGQVIQSLNKPSEALKQAYVDAGIGSIQLAIQSRGLTGVLRDLVATTDGTSEALSELFPNIRAKRFLDAFLGSAGDEILKDLDEITASTGRLLAEREKLIRDTPAFKLQQNLEEFRATLINGFGREFNAFLATAFDNLGGGAEAAEQLVRVLKVGLPIVGALIGTHLVRATSEAIAKLLALRGAAAGVLGPVAGGIGIAVGVGLLIEDLISANSEASKLQRTLAEIAKTGADRRQDFTLDAAENIAESNKLYDEQFKSIAKIFEAQNAGFQDRLVQAKLIEDQLTGSLRQGVQSRLAILDNFAKDSVQIQANAQKQIEQLQRDRFGLEFGAVNDRFNRQLAGSNPDRADQLISRRIKQLLNLSKEAIGKEQFQIAAQILQTADGLADRVNNRLALERQTKTVLQAQLGLNDALLAQEQKKIEEAKAAERIAATSAISIRNDVGLLDAELAKLERLREQGVTGEPLKRVQDNITQLAAALDSKLIEAGAKLQDVLTIRDFRRLADQVVSPVQSAFTANPIRLEFEAAEGLKRFRDSLGSALGDFNLGDQDRSFLGNFLGVDPNSSLQTFNKALGDIKPQLKQANAEFETFKANFAADNAESIDALNASIRSLSNATVKAQTEEFLLKGGNISEFNAKLAETKAGFAELGANITEALKQGNFSDAVADLNKVRDAAIELGQTQFAFPITEQLINAKGVAEQVQDQITKIRDAVGKADGLEAARQKTVELDAAFLEAQRILTQESPFVTLQTQASSASGAVQGLNNVSSNIGTSIQSSTQIGITALGNLEAQARRTAAAVAAANGSGASNGGTFANGGRVGIDSQLGLFQRGESVINRAASARFPGVVTALNSGFGPSRFANGGVVNNIGDINLNVSTSDGSAPTGKQLAADLRRELRRRTSRN